LAPSFREPLTPLSLSKKFLHKFKIENLSVENQPIGEY
jgi:hypothetical protein